MHGARCRTKTMARAWINFTLAPYTEASACLRLCYWFLLAKGVFLFGFLLSSPAHPPLSPFYFSLLLAPWSTDSNVDFLWQNFFCGLSSQLVCPQHRQSSIEDTELPKWSTGILRPSRETWKPLGKMVVTSFIFFPLRLQISWRTHRVRSKRARL